MTSPTAFIAKGNLAILVCLLVAALGCLAACTSYHLGAAGKLGFTALYVAPVVNKVLLPQAQMVISTEVRDAFVRDGRVTLTSTPESADATLQIAVQDYKREAAAVRSDDTGLARKFTLTLGVTCTLRDNRSGKVLFTNRVITVHRDAFTDGGQLQSEYQALPLLAQSLADKVTHAVLDVW